MKVAKCPNCGANITIDETKEAGICEFCNTPFVTEKAVSNINNNTSNNAQTIINNYYGAPPQTNVSPLLNYSGVPQYNGVAKSRPKVNVFIAVCLFYLYIIPGICYVRWVRKKQREWDEANGK